MKTLLTTLLMMCSSKDDRLWLGLVAFVVGAVVLLQRFDVVPTETWEYLWPSILLVTGLKWMLSGDKNSTCSYEACCSMEGCEDCGNKVCTCEVMPIKKQAAKKSKKR